MPPLDTIRELPGNLFQDLDPLVESVLFYDFLPMPKFDTEDWERACQSLIAEQLAGVALRCIREQSLSVPRGVTQRLTDAHFRLMSLTVSARRSSLEGLKLLTQNGISSVVVKGPSIVRLSDHKADRTYVDIDVVVAPTDFKRAESLLKSVGYKQNSSTLPQRNYFNTLCREGINLRDEWGGSIDLHHHISPWFWSTSLSLDKLKERSVDDVLDDSSVVMASPEHSFLVAALHLVSDHGHPGSTHRIWRDLLVIYNRCEESRLISLAREAQLLYWLNWVLRSLPRQLQPNEMLKRLAREDDDSRGVLRLKALLSRRFIDSPHLSQVFRLPPSSVVLYLLGIAFPSREFLHVHFPDDVSYISWWQECVRHLSNRTSEDVPR